MHPLPHKPLTPTERRERAELDLNYQRAQRREMELALEARERGMKEYFKNPNQLHYIVDPDTEVRIKSAHVLCEDETHILKERIMRERRTWEGKRARTEPATWEETQARAEAAAH